MGKKRKCEWKSVLPEHSLGKDFEGLVSVEELEEYNLDDYFNDQPIPKIKKKKSVDSQPSNEPSVKKSVKAKNRGSINEWTTSNLERKKSVTDSSDDFAICENEKLSEDNVGPVGESSNDEIPGMEAWSSFRLETCILKALFQLGFTEPTDIQAQTLHAGLGRKDILGAAETGSGKTLAFGIPIIQGILRKKRQLVQGVQNFGGVGKQASGEKEDRNLATPSFPSSRTNLFALVLTPTRELAVQVKNHLSAVAKFAGLKVTLVVGGLASQKQERLLKKGPEIVVATPGRLWEMIENGNEHLKQVDNISYLAIDETDRMLEKGHFQELQTLLGLINLDEIKKKRRQNFVFSATLTMVHEPPKYITKGQNVHTIITPGQKLQQIISSLGITNPKVVDITHEKGTASTLSEARIICSREEKDTYLYHFVLNHSGRTLVFCNSINCVRRLAKIFQILETKSYPLHAQMEQKQRLKNLDHFRDNPNGVLLATDVAARGLDIPDVQHVIHYEVPQTTESYVHRSGRTARAKKEGLTVVIMEPSETPKYVNLYRSLGRDKDLPEFPVDDAMFMIAKKRVSLARQIENLEYTSKRKSSELNWFKRAAKEMDMLLDEDEIPTKLSEEQTRNIKHKMKILRSHLHDLLHTPVLPKTVSFNCPKLSETNFSKPESAVEKVKKIKGGRRYVKLLK